MDFSCFDHVSYHVFVFFSSDIKRPRVEESTAGDPAGAPDYMQAMWSQMLAQQQQMQMQMPNPAMWNTLSMQFAQTQMKQMTDSFLQMQGQLLDKLNNVSTGQAVPGNSAQSNAVQINDTASVSSDGAVAQIGYDTEHEDFETATQFHQFRKPVSLVEVIEKLYNRLPHLAPPPPSEEKEEGARAKEDLELKGRVKSLPAAPAVLTSFRRFLHKYKKQDGETLVVDEVTGNVFFLLKK